jgi:MFS family permease
MKTALGMSAFMIGLSFSLQYIGDNLFRSPLGWLIDKVGYRGGMLFGLVLAFLSVVLLAFAGRPFTAAAGCLLLGVGTSPLWPCVVTGVTEVAGERGKASILSTVHIAWLTGTGTGPIVMNVLVRDDFALPFGIVVLCMGAAAVLAVFLPSRPRAPAAPSAAGKGASLARVARRISRYWREVRASLAARRRLFPAMFLQTFALGLLTPVVTLYARDVMGLTGEQYSLYIVLCGGLTVGLLWPIGRLVDRYGGVRFLRFGFAGAACALLALPLVHAHAALFAVGMVIGLAYACVIPAWNALIAGTVPAQKRGAVWGVYLTINGMGMVIGPLVSGLLWDRLGPPAPFVASGCVLILLLFFHNFIRNDRKSMIG